MCEREGEIIIKVFCKLQKSPLFLIGIYLFFIYSRTKPWNKSQWYLLYLFIYKNKIQSKLKPFLTERIWTERGLLPDKISTMLMQFSLNSSASVCSLLINSSSFSIAVKSVDQHPIS